MFFLYGIKRKPKKAFKPDKNGLIFVFYFGKKNLIKIILNSNILIILLGEQGKQGNDLKKKTGKQNVFIKKIIKIYLLVIFLNMFSTINLKNNVYF